MKEKVELLVSCMHQNDLSVIERMNIHSDVLLINQCDENQTKEYEYNGYRVREIRTTERGLSNSRNMAIQNAIGSICLLCDDDEILDEDYVEKIVSGYEKIPDADIIAFRMHNQPSRLKQEEQRLNRWTALRISSWQITFRPDAIRAMGLYFDPLLGAGSGNGASEEVKFLRDCIHRKLKAYFIPEDIGNVKNNYLQSGEAEGTWFEGYDEKFFYQRGTVNRYMLGAPVALFYAAYYTIVKKSQYEKSISPKDAFIQSLKGIIGNDIQKQKEGRK